MCVDSQSAGLDVAGDVLSLDHVTAPYRGSKPSIGVICSGNGILCTEPFHDGKYRTYQYLVRRCTQNRSRGQRKEQPILLLFGDKARIIS